jgi:hypothetical protein
MNETTIAAIFNEWMRLYRDEPDRFSREFEAVQSHINGTYGDECAAFFLKLAALVGAEA